MSLTPAQPTYGTDAYINVLFNKTNEIVGHLNNYKVYSALLTQTGTDAPVATVLENTLGLNPTYYYDGVGAYRLEDMQGLFTTGKTFVLGTGTGGAGISININDTTTIEINCINMFEGTTQDDILLDAGFEIRVYN